MKNNLYSSSKLASLCGLDRRTVSNRLAGVAFTKSGSSHLYKLEDALPALCRRQDAEQESERKRLTRLQGDMVQSKLREYDERYVLIDVVNERWRDWALTVRAHILHSTMTQDEKCDVLASIHGELIEKRKARDAELRRELKKDRTLPPEERDRMLKRLEE